MDRPCESCLDDLRNDRGIGTFLKLGSNPPRLDDKLGRVPFKKGDLMGNAQKERRFGYMSGILLVFKVLLSLFTCLSATETWIHNAGTVKWMFSILFVCSVASIICRWNWVVPCTSAGLVIGMFSDCVVKGGSIEDQVQQTLFRFCSGVVAGFLVGLILERSMAEESGMATEVVKGN